MKVKELYAEMGTNDAHLAHLQQADEAAEDFDVVVDVVGSALAEADAVAGVRWDHAERRMIIELSLELE